MISQLLGLAGWLLVSFSAAGIGAVATSSAGSFSEQLARPGWAPPASVFGPVWSALYLLMGIAAWLVWRERGFWRRSSRPVVVSGAVGAQRAVELDLLCLAAWGVGPGRGVAPVGGDARDARRILARSAARRAAARAIPGVGEFRGRAHLCALAE